MQINISARHGDLAQETQQKIHDRLQKIVRFHDRISSIGATIDLKQAARPEVEILVSIEKAHDFFSKITAEGGNLLGAVDAASHKVEDQLKKYKQKRIDQHRGSSRHEMQAGSDDDQGE